MPNRIIFSVYLVGPYQGLVWAILGPCFDYLYKIFACGCLKWLQFSLESYACQIEDYSLKFSGTIFGSTFGHIRAMFWLFLQYLCLQMPVMTQIFTEVLCIGNSRIPFELLEPYHGPIWAVLGPCFPIFTVSLLLYAINGNIFH